MSCSLKCLTLCDCSIAEWTKVKVLYAAKVGPDEGKVEYFSGPGDTLGKNSVAELIYFLKMAVVQ